MATRFSHVVGFDDAPFARERRGDVPVVGAVFAGTRLEGVLCARVRRDGANSTARLAELVTGSKFAGQLQLVLLQGIALAGFNVVDVPRLARIRAALLSRVAGGARKWALIERLGPMAPVAGVWVQRVGLTLAEAELVVRRLAVHSALPEPLRTAHLIAGGLATGQSRGRA